MSFAAVSVLIIAMAVPAWWSDPDNPLPVTMITAALAALRSIVERLDGGPPRLAGT
jgi:hypothetical protein